MAVMNPVPQETNIHQIRIHEPHPLAVSLAQRFLDDTKAGEVQGFVGVVIFDNGNVDQFWVDPPKRYHTTVVSDRMVGAMVRMQHKLMDIKCWGGHGEEDGG